MTRSDRYALKTILFLLALSALTQTVMAGEGDKAWLLLAAREWLGGKRLYVDVVEVNPPLILWMYAVAVKISLQVSWLKDTTVLGFMGLLSVTACVFVNTRLIRLHDEFTGNHRRRVEFTLLLACIFLLMIPPDFFFDREHILLLFTFPYVMRFMPGLQGRTIPLKLRIAVGVLAAVGFCIKPHGLLFFLGIQLLCLWRHCRVSVVFTLENFIVIVLGGLYLICVWHFAPEYITTILPMALDTYFAFSRHGSILLCIPPALFCAGLTFADFRLRYRSPYRRDIYYFIGVLLLLLLHALVSNGWDYTYEPLMTVLLFLSGFVGMEYRWLKEQAEANGETSRGFVFGIRGCGLSLASQGIYMAVMTIVSFSVAGQQVACERREACLNRNPYVHYVRQHDVHTFGTITLEYTPWVSLVRHSGAEWQTRFNCLWMLPGLFEQYQAGDHSHAEIAGYVARSLAQDMDMRKPDVVFVDISRQFFAYPNRIDLVEFLKETPQFAAAWSVYHYSDTIDRCNAPDAPMFKNACKYDIYSRNP